MPVSINTNSGGTINLLPGNSGIRGHQLYIHVDQTANVNNGDDEATIAVTPDEVKKLILLLDEYVSFVEGKKYVAVIDYENKAKEKNERGIVPDVLKDDGNISPTGQIISS